MRKGSRRVPWDPEIKNLLIIAGLSGCGKSTFIRQLKHKRLPPDIARHLPADIHDWHHAWGKRRRISFRLLRPPAKPRGQILHFDMTTSTAYRKSFAEGKAVAEAEEPHREEKQLNTLLAAAEEVRFVVIRASRDQLIRQLSARVAVIHLPAPLRPMFSRAGPLMLRLERLVPSGVKETAGHLGIRWMQRSGVRERNFRNCQRYAQDAAIDSIHRDWEASVREQLGNKAAGSTTYIEPAPNGIWRRKFRVAETSMQTPATQSVRPRLDKALEASFGRLQHFADELDNAFRIPGTKATVGFDAALGIVPIIGDAISGSIGAYIIWKARRLGAPRKLVARMIVNSTLDLLIGCVPIAGDIFDASYKSNVRNVTLLRRHLAGLDLFHVAAG